MTKPEDGIAKFDLRSEDIAEARRQELLRLFPEAHTESGGVNFEALRLSLGDAVKSGPEIFGMSWPGKAECAKTIQKQSIATLLPVEEESVNWDTTQNVIIEGDNLEVLKAMRKAYLGKVKMIYIDPPYNTGKDFIYPDNYSESLQTYLEYTGQAGEGGRRFSTNIETEGRFHSKWLSMIYPRLILARDLLTEDGVIFISIDDTEDAHLRGIMDEVFGASNFVAKFGVRTPNQTEESNLLKNMDYLLTFAKDSRKMQFTLPSKPQSARCTTSNPDQTQPEIEFPAGVEVIGVEDGVYDSPTSTGGLEDIEVVRGRLVVANGCLQEPVTLKARWSNPNDLRAWCTKIRSGSKEVIFNKFGKELTRMWMKGTRFQPQMDKIGFELPESHWDHFGTPGSDVLARLFGRRVFSYPKHPDFVQFLVSIGTGPTDLVLDFFAGSGTTGHAVMAQNVKDGGSRRFILVQLPEPVDAASEAAKAGFGTISDITKERVRRAAKEFDKEVVGTSTLKVVNGSSQHDLGFRLFQLSASNFAVWDADAIEGDQTKLEQQLFAQVEHILPGRASQDILFELMLKSRFELTTPVEEVRVGKCEVWKVAGGEMVAIIDLGLTIEVIREIAGWKPTSVVILDRCFEADDSLKANARKIFEDSKIDLKTV